MINLHEPSIGKREWKYIKRCIDTKWVSSAGKYVKLFEDKIAKYTRARVGGIRKVVQRNF